MLTKIQAALAPPVFADEEKTRTAALLNIILLSALVFAILYGISAPFVYDHPASTIISAALAILVWSAALLLMRRGQVQLAAGAFLSMLWLAATIVAVSREGIRAPAAGTYITVIFTAGLLLGSRGGLAFAVLSGLAGTGMYYAEASGLVIFPVAPTPFVAWTGLLTHLILAMVVLHLAARSINEALARARANERALAERTLDLTRINEQLERGMAARQRAEAALRESEERFRRMADNIQDGLTIIEYGKTVYVNDRVCEIFGYSRDELVNLDTLAIAAPEERERLAQVVRQARQTSASPRELEFWIIRKDGARRCIRNRYSLSRRNGEIVGRYVVTSDVTERKLAEEALRESEERYRSLVETSPDAITLTDLEGNILICNQQAVALYGFDSVDQVLGRNAFDNIASEDRARAAENARRTLDKGTVRNAEYTFVRRDGSCFVGELSASLVLDAAGRPKSLIGIARDITERKRAEEQLRQLKEFNEQIVQNMAEGVIIQDAAGYMTFVNPAAAAMLGYPVGGLVQQHWTKIVPPDQQPIVEAANERRAQGLTDRYELELVRQDGARLAVLISGRPQWVESRFAGSLAVFTDISDLKQAEAVLQRQLQELTILSAIAIAGAEATSEDALIERATQIIGDTLYPDNFGVMLLDEAMDLLIPHPSYRTIREGRLMSIPLGQGVTGDVALDGQPTLVPDVSCYPGYIQADYATRSELCVPLKMGERCLGVINVESADLNAFTPADERLLMTLAGQLSTAIGKVRLLEAERRRRQEAETLRDAANALASTLDLDQVLASLLLYMERAIPYDSACVFLLEGDQIRAVAGRGFPPYVQVIGQVFPASSPLFQESLVTGRPFILTDAQADPRFQRWGGADYVRGWMQVPLMARGEIVGRLTLDSRQVGAYSEADAALAQALANQAASAIENARLFKAERQARQQAETLRAATQALSATLDLQQVFKLILSELQKVLPYDSASVQQLKGDTLEIIGGHGFPNLQELLGVGFDLLADDNPNREVVGKRAPVILEDAPALYSGFRREPHDKAAIHSWLGVPLLFGDRVIGMIALDKKEKGFYAQEHAQLAQAFAAQAAIAIENARLYAEAQAQARALAAALAELQELDRLKSEFIQNVSHELRMPLSIIMGYAELLDSGELGELQPDQREPVAVITRRCRMLRKLVDDLTIILEAEAGNLKLEPVDVAELVTTLLADLEAPAQKARLSLSAEVAPVPCLVAADATNLRRVLDNLVGNALKFTPAGGAVTIRLAREPRQDAPDDVVLQVADTGIGIPADKLERIFDRFYQVDGSTSRRYGGVGLGLALVKEIVEAHGGQVSVQSIQGQGSTFRIVLPGLKAPA